MPASGRIAAAPGAAGVLAIRPERLRLSAGGDGVPAEVVDLIYLGNARRFVLRLPDGQEWSALMQAGPAEAVTSRPGDAVRLSWREAHATVFPA